MKLLIGKEVLVTRSTCDSLTGVRDFWRQEGVCVKETQDACLVSYVKKNIFGWEKIVSEWFQKEYFSQCGDLCIKVEIIDEEKLG